MNKENILSYLVEYKELYKNKYHIKRIGLFGSVARDDFTDKSDIDIVVELEKQDFFELIGIKQDIENKFHKAVDIVSYREKMNPFLKQRINKEAIYV